MFAMFKHNWSRMLVFAIFLIGIYLNFRNLWGAVYLDEDEARAFTLLNSGPMLYLICNPFFVVFYAEHGAFYAAALIGVLGMYLFYRLIEELAGRRVAVFSVAFYAIFPMRLNFARSLYPQVFIDFFFLLLLLIFVHALRRGRRSLLIVCGVLTACLVYVHPSTYALIAGFIFAWLAAWRMEKHAWDIGELTCWGLRYILGLAAGYFFLERLLLWIDPRYCFTERLLWLVKYEHAEALSSGNNLVPFLRTLWSEITFSPVSIFRSICVIAATVFTAVAAVRLRKRKLLFILTLSLVTLTIFFADVLRGSHEVRIRHFSWLTFPISLMLGFACADLLKNPTAWKKWLVGAGMSVFLFTSLFDSYMVTTEVFKTKDIEDWLISNHFTAGMLTFLHFYRIPYNLPPVTRHPSWKQQSQKYQIIWPLVYQAYLRGKCKYIVPSGMSANATLAEGDVMFQYLPPEKSWVHPYSLFKYRIFGLKTRRPEAPLLIRFYRLEDVFSSSNIRKIMGK